MKIRWEGDMCLADQATIAELYGVSEATVRRHCPPAREHPSRGRGSTQREYDAIAADDQLAGIVARPERTAAAIRRTRVAAALNHRTPSPEGNPQP